MTRRTTKRLGRRRLEPGEQRRSLLRIGWWDARVALPLDDLERRSGVRAKPGGQLGERLRRPAPSCSEPLVVTEESRERGSKRRGLGLILGRGRRLRTPPNQTYDDGGGQRAEQQDDREGAAAA